MKTLVTGGAGFIGSNLVDALVARGDEVAVIDNLATPQAPQQGEHLLQERAAFGFADVLGQQLRGGGLA